jgi:DNA-binding NarL/FixJ family response regulator
MSSQTLYRWSGIVLLVGSLFGVIGSILDTVLIPGHGETAQQILSTSYTIDASLFLAWALLLVMGLPGLYIRQATRAGVLGFVGFVLLSLGLLLGGVAFATVQVTIFPYLAQSAPKLLPSGGTGPISGFLLWILVPGLNGIEATRRILQASPRVGILVLTMLEDDASVFAAMRAGARGYLLKGADQADVLRAIRVVAHGEAIFSPSIAQRLMQYFANMQPLLPQAAFPDLTEREREILGLIALGKSNAEIAEELVLSPKTVSNHVSNIFSKLQVVDRAQAILRAKQAGWG